MKKIILLSIFSVFLSCKCTKTTSDNSSKKLDKKKEDYLSEGYKIGSFIINDRNTCSVLLKDNEDVLYEPINFENKEFKSFVKADKTIMFKFLPLRRMNSCDAQPIELTDIINFEE